jgi:hypothetical protein
MTEQDPNPRKTSASSTQTNRVARPFDKADCVCTRFENESLEHATLEEIERISNLVDIDGNARLPGADVIDIIYKGTSEGDHARRLIVDMLAEMPVDIGWDSSAITRSCLTWLASSSTRAEVRIPFILLCDCG